MRPLFIAGALLALPAGSMEASAQAPQAVPNGVSAAADLGGVAPPPASVGVPRPGLRATAASFIDSLFASQMEQRHIPGAAIVIVKDGHVVLQKGYGVAEVRSKRPVSPESTLFGVGSLSKLITTTAVLQLRDRGLLDLDSDINRYLTRFKLREQYGQPVKLRHLLTHTAGFDRRYVGIAAPSADRIVPLEEFLAMRLPPRVRPPGEMYLYSDYGMALAGYLVEVRSGMPFARYARERILAPLGMTQSSFEPQAFDRAHIAEGYRYDHGQYVARTHAFVNASPAGALVTTAADMARFLTAQLQPGDSASAKVLAESSVREMQSRHFAPHPRLPGVAYAYHEDHYYGQRALRHDGWMSGVASIIYVVPERRIGFFAVFTGDGEDEMIWELIKLTHEYDEPVVKTPAPERSIAGFDQRAPSVTGSYRKLQYALRGVEHSANVLLAPRISVARNADSTLTLDRADGPVRLVEVEPDVYEWSNGYGYVTFQRNSGGDVERLFMHQEVYRRLAWYETPEFLRRAGIAFLVIFATAPLIWVVAGFVRTVRKRAAAPRAARAAIAIAVLLCAGNVAFMVGMIPAFGNTTVQELALGLPPSINALLVLPRVTTMLALAALAAALLAWRESFWSAPTRLHYAIVSLTGLAYVPFLLHLGLLSIPFSEQGSAQRVAVAEQVTPAAAPDSAGIAASR
ncbi:MAG TPA: serine hydrolase domain-containing protein [Gemmatimonadaceae bacterium]|nr:serine hydrolase domain-containing protein [Gemmatimonadaceae bacterium]